MDDLLYTLLTDLANIATDTLAPSQVRELRDRARVLYEEETARRERNRQYAESKAQQTLSWEREKAARRKQQTANRRCPHCGKGNAIYFVPGYVRPGQPYYRCRFCHEGVEITSRQWRGDEVAPWAQQTA